MNLASSTSLNGVLRLDDSLGQTLPVAVVQRPDQLGQRQALILGHVAHHAHIQKDDLRCLWIDPDVARMRVGVEEAVEQDLLQHGAQEFAGQGVAAHAGGIQLLPRP